MRSGAAEEYPDRITPTDVAGMACWIAGSDTSCCFSRLRIGYAWTVDAPLISTDALNAAPDGHPGELCQDGVFRNRDSDGTV